MKSYFGAVAKYPQPPCDRSGLFVKRGENNSYHLNELRGMLQFSRFFMPVCIGYLPRATYSHHNKAKRVSKHYTLLNRFDHEHFSLHRGSELSGF